MLAGSAAKLHSGLQFYPGLLFHRVGPMQISFARCAAVILAAILGISPATPALAKRIALVIGNQTYQVGPLTNPVNDAEAVAAALGRLGFDKVEVKRNLDAQGMKAALRSFGTEVQGADIAVVYFAGHGTENNGVNYLIPVDAQLARASDLDFEAVRLESILSTLDGAKKLKLVILDACRNTIFPLSGGKRSQTRGLARIEPEDNTLVAYAAKEGTVADDGLGGTHSPFTAALLRHMETPGVEVDYIFRLVRDDVAASTSRQQVPHLYGTQGRERVYFKALDGLPVPLVTLPAPPASTPPAESDAKWAWSLVKDSTDPIALQAFAERYGETFYADLASGRIDKLKREQQAMLPPAPAPTANAEAKPTPAPAPSARPDANPEAAALERRVAAVEAEHGQKLSEKAKEDVTTNHLLRDAFEEFRTKNSGPLKGFAGVYDFTKSCSWKTDNKALEDGSYIQLGFRYLIWFEDDEMIRTTFGAPEVKVRVRLEFIRNFPASPVIKLYKAIYSDGSSNTIGFDKHSYIETPEISGSRIRYTYATKCTPADRQLVWASALFDHLRKDE